ncbi:MAG: DUF2169 domain-containing protein [Deltaproteobacteria bacterium]|nr:DUF2169 domain-containing protein [Deltaproteobacteria bacterium]MCB9786330.1 DUF2169 domain-containing protein [Deltaproteobacteria bacterium]
MPDFEDSGYQGMWLPGRRVDGDEGIAVIAKRRFAIDLASAACVPSDDATPVRMTAEHLIPDDPANSSVVRAPEIALHKPKVDVIVLGSAYAPGGKPAKEFEVRLRIAGVVERRLRIVGPRVAHWVAPKKMLSKKERDKGEEQLYPTPVFGEPEPVAKLPLRYEYAFGGKAAIVLDEYVQELAEAAKEKQAEKLERKERAKAIEEQVRKEEEAKEAAAQAKADKGKVTDEGAREKADAAFGDGATGFLDAEMLARLEAEEGAEEHLDVASPYRLGEQDEVAPAEATGDADDEEEAGEATEEAEAPGPFSEGTAVIDITDLETRDELGEVLSERHLERRAQLTDGEGTMLVRTEGMGDVSLTDEGWIDEAGRRPEPVEAPVVEESPYPLVPSPSNPVGRGFCVCPLEPAVEGLPLPSIEDPERPLRPEELVRDILEVDFMALPTPVGFAPYPCAWFPRAALAGVMPWDLETAKDAMKKATEGLDPEDPDDADTIARIEAMEIPVMQAGWFQEAHPWLQVERLNGDEEVYLDNLTPEGNLFFRLPGMHPTATVDLGRGESRLFLTLDTLTIDLEEAEHPAVELLWRGWYPLRDMAQLDEATKLEFRLGEVDQVDYMDLAREAETGSTREGGLTSFIQAMPDEDEEDERFTKDAEADRKYKDVVARAPTSEGVGPPKDEGGTAIIDLEGEHRLTEDWEEPYTEGKGAVEEDAAARAKEKAKAKEAAIKKKARERLIEELGPEDAGEDEES